jgi:lipopolysaccharide transport system ATP-binding protein
VLNLFNGLILLIGQKRIVIIHHCFRFAFHLNTGEVTISEVHLLDEQGNVTEFASVGHRVSLQVNVESLFEMMRIGPKNRLP